MQGRSDRGSHYRPGDWLVQCDQCGFRRYASQVSKQWNGLIVCSDTCFDERHPQEFVRGLLDHQVPPFVRPETRIGIPVDIFSLTVDSEEYTVDQLGDRFLDVNEVTADSL